MLKVTEAANLLRIGRSTLYVLMQTGRLPVVRIGRAVRIPTRAVREYAERLEAEQARQSGGPA